MCTYHVRKEVKVDKERKTGKDALNNETTGHGKLEDVFDGEGGSGEGGNNKLGNH